MKLWDNSAVLALSMVAACSSNSPFRGDGGAAGTHASKDGGAGTTGGAGTSGSSGTSGTMGAAGQAGTTGAAGTTDAGTGPDGPITVTFDPRVTKDVDLVFMIDDSTSMQPLQKKLIDSFPSFITALQNQAGGLPSLHIGIVSSSMGAGHNPNIAHCEPGGDQGMFQTKPLGTTCAQGMLNAGQSFIVASPAGNNFTGDLADVFSCIAPLGAAGCGFEHQFASVLRALGADGAPAPASNANFLRPNALLEVVLLTNEDDCSAPPNSDLFDVTTGDLSDPHGPLDSYRCNEYGHLCGGQPPPRTPSMPVDLSGTCISAEDGRLLRVQDVVAALKALKADPRDVLVSVIGGPPSPYVVDSYSDASTSNQAWPEVEHSCSAPDGTFADPGIRLAQLATAFGGTGSYTSICSDGLGAQTIAAQLAAAAGGWQCLDVRDPESRCTFVDHLPGGGTAALPSCSTTTNAAAPCWSSQPSASCAGGYAIQFTRDATQAVTSTTATCTP